MKKSEEMRGNIYKNSAFSTRGGGIGGGITGGSLQGWPNRSGIHRTEVHSCKSTARRDPKGCLRAFRSWARRVGESALAAPTEAFGTRHPWMMPSRDPCAYPGLF